MTMSPTWWFVTASSNASSSVTEIDNASDTVEAVDEMPLRTQHALASSTAAARSLARSRITVRRCERYRRTQQLQLHGAPQRPWLTCGRMKTENAERRKSANAERRER